MFWDKDLLYTVAVLCLLEPTRFEIDFATMNEARMYEHPQGLRPGMRHNGQFQTGNDGRRFVQKLANGRTLASYAREYTQEAVEVLVSVVKGDMADVRPSDRIRAAEILLDRGHGKAPQVVQLEPSPATVVNMTRAELRAIAAAALLPPIEGESTPITTSLPPPVDAEHIS
jgi:hypothetical protein